MVPAIELRGLCKAFGTLQAVDHLTLAVEQGEIFGLLGPNGSGKTTTINLISGISTPTSGEMQVMGYEVCLSEGTVRNHLSVAMQKLGARNRMEAARLAEQKGWL